MEKTWHEKVPKLEELLTEKEKDQQGHQEKTNLHSCLN